MVVDPFGGLWPHVDPSDLRSYIWFLASSPQVVSKEPEGWSSNSPVGEIRIPVIYPCFPPYCKQWSEKPPRYTTSYRNLSNVTCLASYGVDSSPRLQGRLPIAP